MTLPGGSIFLPWTNGVDVKVFQRILSPKVESLRRPLILSFISQALFDCLKGAAGRENSPGQSKGRGRWEKVEKERKRETRDALLFLAQNLQNVNAKDSGTWEINL